MGLVTILGAIGSLIAGPIERHQKLKAVRAEAEAKVIVARAEAEVTRLQKAQDAETAWDQIAAEQMDTSWKDEWFAILLSVPAVLAFCGTWGRDIVAGGFKALNEMPEWYMYSFLTAIAASFGVRKLIEYARTRR